ncbi:hypothetical protein M9435_004130 [Picochlorum sp. BPE23]|nr:hypothetical protein M9435_004130 [Picochlorum sp. BPE23]
MDYQQGKLQGTEGPSPRMTVKVLNRLAHTPPSNRGSYSVLRRLHHAILKLERDKEVRVHGNMRGAPDAMGFYESKFKEFMAWMDQLPEYREATTCLEDLWGGYQRCAQEIFSLLRMEIKEIQEVLVSVKEELESHSISVHGSSRAGSERESASSSVLNMCGEGSDTVESVTSDHAISEARDHIDNLERENEDLREQLGRVMRENESLAEEKECIESNLIRIRMRLEEVDAADASKTPRPTESLDDLSDLVGDDELARQVEKLAKDLDIEKVGLYLKAEREDDQPMENENMNRLLQIIANVDKNDLDKDSLIFSLSRRRGSTAKKFHALESQCLSLHRQKCALSVQLASFQELEGKRILARQRHQEEMESERKNAIQKYLSMLADKGEEAWKDQLIGMGTGPDVPKLYKFGGKIRNKHMSKRDTEKLVREVWKERMSMTSMQKHVSLVDFLGNHLQKKVGIAVAVVELGYNFLYSLWRYQWDADCELFLKVLTGDIKEEVFFAQNNLQIDLEELFECLDKAAGQTAGMIPKSDLTVALRSFFRVGSPGGKSEKRFEDILHCLEKDQPGTHVEWAKLFEEDREYNQGDFAECIRDQFLSERVELYDAICVALYEECGEDEFCNHHQVATALMVGHPSMKEKDALLHASRIFDNAESDQMAVKAILRHLSEVHFDQNGLFEEPQEKPGKKSKSHAHGKLTKSSSLPKTVVMQRRQNPLIEKALEDVRQSWVATV